MKSSKIWWLFNDNSVAYIDGRPFQSKAIAWKLEKDHPWNYNMLNSPQNYFK